MTQTQTKRYNNQMDTIYRRAIALKLKRQHCEHNQGHYSEDYTGHLLCKTCGKLQDKNKEL